MMMTSLRRSPRQNGMKIKSVYERKIDRWLPYLELIKEQREVTKSMAVGQTDQTATSTTTELSVRRQRDTFGAAENLGCITSQRYFL